MILQHVHFKLIQVTSSVGHFLGSKKTVEAKVADMLSASVISNNQM